MTPILGILASQISGHLAAGTAFDSIATVNVGAGGSSSIDFTSIPSTYKHLQIRTMSLSARANDDIAMQFNGDTATNYSQHRIVASGSTVSSYGFSNTSFVEAGFSSAGSSFPSVVVMDILDYQNTNKYKTTRYLNGTDSNGGGYLIYESGSWRSTSAITSIKLYIPGSYSFTQYSQFALYGVKG
jgi:hypothetical protein